MSPEPAPMLGVLPTLIERRRKPRIQCAFPATVRGVDGCGHRFIERTCLDNLSTVGAYLCMRRVVVPGIHLSVSVRVVSSQAPAGSGPRLLLYGVVTRVAQEPDGRYGVAIQLERFRFV